MKKKTRPRSKGGQSAGVDRNLKVEPANVDNRLKRLVPANVTSVVKGVVLWLLVCAWWGALGAVQARAQGGPSAPTVPLTDFTIQLLQASDAAAARTILEVTEGGSATNAIGNTNGVGHGLTLYGSAARTNLLLFDGDGAMFTNDADTIKLSLAPDGVTFSDVGPETLDLGMDGLNLNGVTRLVKIPGDQGVMVETVATGQQLQLQPHYANGSVGIFPDNGATNVLIGQGGHQVDMSGVDRVLLPQAELALSAMIPTPPADRGSLYATTVGRFQFKYNLAGTETILPLGSERVVMPDADWSDDAAPAINTAAQRLAQDGLGGIVQLPSGLVLLDSGLTNYPSVTWRGVNQGRRDAPSGTLLVARGAMESVFTDRGWTTDEYSHWAAIRDMTILATNANYAYRSYNAGENLTMENVHIHSAKKSALWITGSAANFFGKNIVINHSADKAIRITRHPTLGAGEGTIFFDGLSGDWNTNGWFVVNTGSKITIQDWKIEEANVDHDSFPAGGALILVTDNAYDGIAAATGSFLVDLTVIGGRQNINPTGNPSYTNRVRVDGTTDAQLLYREFGIRHSFHNHHAVWNAVSGDGVWATNANADFLYVTPGTDRRATYDLNHLTVAGNLSVSDGIARAKTLGFPAYSPPSTVISTTNLNQSFSRDADTDFTFSSTPSAGDWFGFTTVNLSTETNINIGHPEMYDPTLGTVTNFTLAVDSEVSIRVEYDGTKYIRYGAPITADDLAESASPAGTNLVEVFDQDSWSYKKVQLGNLTGTPFAYQYALTNQTDDVATGTGNITFRAPHAMTITEVRASLKTAQSSGTVFTVDINDSGTTILSTKLTIDNSEKTSTTAATPAVISDSAIADDAEITIDIDAVGTGGVGPVVTIIGTR